MNKKNIESFLSAERVRAFCVKARFDSASCMLRYLQI